MTDLTLDDDFTDDPGADLPEDLRPPYIAMRALGLEPDVAVQLAQLSPAARAATAAHLDMSHGGGPIYPRAAAHAVYAVVAGCGPATARDTWAAIESLRFSDDPGGWADAVAADAAAVEAGAAAQWWERWARVAAVSDQLTDRAGMDPVSDAELRAQAAAAVRVVLGHAWPGLTSREPSAAELDALASATADLGIAVSTEDVGPISAAELRLYQAMAAAIEPGSDVLSWSERAGGCSRPEFVQLLRHAAADSPQVAEVIAADDAGELPDSDPSIPRVQLADVGAIGPREAAEVITTRAQAMVLDQTARDLTEWAGADPASQLMATLHGLRHGLEDRLSELEAAGVLDRTLADTARRHASGPRSALARLAEGRRVLAADVVAECRAARPAADVDDDARISAALDAGRVPDPIVLAESSRLEMLRHVAAERSGLVADMAPLSRAEAESVRQASRDTARMIMDGEAAAPADPDVDHGRLVRWADDVSSWDIDHVVETSREADRAALDREADTDH